MMLRSRALHLASSLLFTASILAAPSLASADSGGAIEGSGQILLSDLLGVRTGGMGYLSMLTPGYFSPAMTGLVGYSHQELGSMQSPFLWQQRRDTVSVNPSVDVLVSRRLSLGVSIGYGRVDVDDQVTALDTKQQFPSHEHGELLAVAPRVGYSFPLGHGFSLWPRIGAAYSRSFNALHPIGSEPRAEGRLVAEQWAGGADIGLVYRPIRPLYFSAGPELSVAFSRFQQQQGDVRLDQVNTFNVRIAGTLSMGVVLGR
ncbi:MAG: hypothetical protein U0359_34005 [Byssovorax sp.]